MSARPHHPVDYLSAMSLTLPDLQSWLDRYVAAWRSNDAALIGALFTEDVRYRYHPGEEPVVGRDAVVASWLESPDDPESWTADYRAWSVTGDHAAATGETRYADGDHFYNVFVLVFHDGACAEFTEWFFTEWFVRPREH